MTVPGSYWETQATPAVDSATPAATADGSFWERIAGDKVSNQTLSGLVTGAAPQVGYGEDIGKGLVGGVARGTTGLIGGAGTVGDLVHAGLSKLGVPEDYIKTGAGIVRRIPQIAAFAGPSGADVQKAVENYTGPFYQPKTVPGQYASTFGEFLPAAAIPGGGSVGARLVNTGVGAIGSETAGQFTKGTPYEPYARFAGGIISAPTAAKIITPAAAASPARQTAVQTFEREGIPVSAGQRTGSRPIQTLESNAADMPGAAGKAREMAAEQSAAYDRAVTSRMFERGQLTSRGVPPEVNLPDPRVVAAGKQSLSDEYDRILQANQFRSDPTLLGDFHGVQTNYHANALPSQRPSGARDIEAIHNDIVDKLVAGQGGMPGTEYQAIRSRLRQQASEAYKSNNSTLGDALKGTQKALDDAMARNLPAPDRVALTLNNQRYANMRQIENAVAKGVENLSPLAVAQTARVGRPGQYAAQQGSLDELARAGALLMKPLPNSQTAARLGMQKLFDIPKWVAASGASGAAGSMFGLPGALVGAVAPFAASRLALSRPGQAYLGNQALPQNMRDVLTQALVQQAASQPSGIARNEQERANYENKRKLQRVIVNQPGRK